MKITRTRLLEITAVIILAAVFLRVFLSLELYSDDIYYASFFQNGFSGFWEKARDHFLNFNGRSLVHGVIWCALALGRGFTALLMTATLLSIPLLYSRLNGGKSLMTAAFFLLLLMSPSPMLLKESLFWTSGFFNYVFPFLCFISALLLAKKAARTKKLSLLALIGASQLLLAATMEQIGAATAFATLLFALSEMLRQRRFLPNAALSPVCGALGVISIFASPATRARLDAEVAGGICEFARSSVLCFARVGSHIISYALLICLAFLAVSATASKRTSLRVSAAVTAAALIAAKISGGTLLCLAAFLALCAYTVACGILLMLRENLRFLGILPLSGVFSVALISVTRSAEPRSALMMTLCLALFTAMLLSSSPTSRNRINIAQNGAKALTAVLCAAAFIPTLTGYLKNEAVRNENLAAIESAKQTGELYYRVDYDPEYAHSLMFDDGHFYNTFVDLHGLRNAEIRLVSDIFPSIECNGSAVTCPAWEKDGERFFPLEPIVNALGGSVSWSPQKTEIRLAEKLISVAGSTATAEDVSFDVSESLRRDFFCMLVTEDFLERVLGLEAVFSAEENRYKIYQK